MKRILALTILVFLLLSGCAGRDSNGQVVATTRPVYCFTQRLLEGTPITSDLLITQNTSCLHDYTLQVSQMRMLEGARVIAVSGAGLEDFLEDAIPEGKPIIDASRGIALTQAPCDHEEHDHHHGDDPHIWLSPLRGKQMVENLRDGLADAFPRQSTVIRENAERMLADLDELQAYGSQELRQLSTREMITFHDGFAYFAEAFDLHILRAMEEEPGSEVSAGELKELIRLVEDHNIPAIFTETNGSAASASVIAAETGAGVYTLDMAFSDRDYFDAMYENIRVVKEALQ